MLAVSYTTESSRARALLADLEPPLDERERPLANAAHEAADRDFEVILNEWCSMDGTTIGSSPSGAAAETAEIEQEAAKYMRRLGFQPPD